MDVIGAIIISLGTLSIILLDQYYTGLPSKVYHYFETCIVLLASYHGDWCVMDKANTHYKIVLGNTTQNILYHYF